MMQEPPQSLIIHSQSGTLEVAFSDDDVYQLPFEYLRVYSPSAEVRGHAPGEEVLQTGKRSVKIKGIEPVGNYGMKPAFSDGHVSGIYTWDYLRELGRDYQIKWEAYLQDLDDAGFTREAGRDFPMA